jgi:hypothetical protein
MEKYLRNKKITARLCLIVLWNLPLYTIAAPKNKSLNDIYVVDTIFIQCPLMIKFKESEQIGTAIISCQDTMGLEKGNYFSFIQKQGFVFVGTYIYNLMLIHSKNISENSKENLYKYEDEYCKFGDSCDQKSSGLSLKSKESNKYVYSSPYTKYVIAFVSVDCYNAAFPIESIKLPKQAGFVKIAVPYCK